jgi:hypothetical protein
VRTFDDISHGRSQISVCDLTRFLERNAFYPRHTDIEAILRRIDHNADQAISYDEFCELTTIVDPKTSAASPIKEKKVSPKQESSQEESKDAEKTIKPFESPYGKTTLRQDQNDNPV